MPEPDHILNMGMPTGHPSPVDKRSQEIINYILANQDNISYHENLTLVINFTRNDVNAKITYKCEL